MNESSSGERVLSDGGTRSTAAAAPNGHGRRPTLLTWSGATGHRLESARVVLGEQRLRALGRVVEASTGPDRPAYHASYELAVDDSGAVSRLSVFSTTAEHERQVTLSRSGEGIWLVEHNQGEVAQRTEFGGSLDVDVLDCVLFNALPIRRLGLHRNPQTVELSVVYVSLPNLSVELSKQTYRTLSVSDEGAVVEYSCGDFLAELTVDRDGTVVDYPGLAARI